MKKTILLLLTVFLTLPCTICAQKTVNLAGKWDFQIDRNGVGEQQKWYATDAKFDDFIELPGSMPERLKGDIITTKTQWVGAIYDSSYYHNPYMEKYREAGKMKIPFFLTPSRHYVGKAWYRKVVTLNDEVPLYNLYMERPHIMSRVWVNGKEVLSLNGNTPVEGWGASLSVPHVFFLGDVLQKGENTIVVCIDNDYRKVDVGGDSHSVTDQTQGCWNGITGRIELQPVSMIDYVKVYPDIDRGEARVEIKNYIEKLRKTTITLRAEAFNTAQKQVFEKTFNINSKSDLDTISLVLPMQGAQLWDEFTPNLYRLTVEMKADKETYTAQTVFGMRKIEIRDRMFYVNGREIQLRGTVENCLFPNTGYPPTDVESWLKVFRRCKEYGLNHMRFHSYCPPEAAFTAADMVGFYLQPEGPSWPNHGVSLRTGQYIDEYLADEAIRICDEYGNHPSFTFYAFGNEPAGRWVEWCNDNVPIMKSYDSRHIYAGFSVGGGWAWQPGAEYAVKAGARGLNEWANRAPESTFDFSKAISIYNGRDLPEHKITVPFVTHEMGQWCAFPNFDEIGKYKGVNKATNFEIFRDVLAENGMESMGKKFLMAAGKLQTLCYKFETERILRTPNYAGFQILSINDYSGQGSALVGLTDVFYDDKGYCTAEDFREFCSPVVPLAKFPKFTYSNTETFTAELSVNNHSKTAISSVSWSITDKQNTIIAQGSGYQVNVPLSSVTKAQKLTLRVKADNAGMNHWDFYVYPAQLAPVEGVEKGVYVTETLDEKAIKTLKKGGKVLLCAAGKVTYGREVKQQWTPVFWNTSWFKMRPPHTTGIYVENEHPVFADFPTDYHSDTQWWELVNKAQVMQLTDFPKDFQPIVQSIDTWFISRKIGMLIEANVQIAGSKKVGKLMMTTMDITSDLDRRIVARQMRHSILQYMMSDKFAPKWNIPVERISDLYTKVAGEVNMFTNDSPEELKPKI